MKTRIIFAAILFACGVIANAQTPAAVNQVDQIQLRKQLDQTAQTKFNEGDSAPELYSGENSDVGPQSVLRIKPRRTWVDATADAQYFYSDNMFLDDKFKIDTGVLVSTAEIALAPTAFDAAGGKLAPRVGYRHQWFDFGFDGERISTPSLRLSDFDFNAQTVFGELRWSRNDWIWDAGVDYTRLMTTRNYDEFYREWLPHWGLEKVFPLNDKMAFSLGYEGNYHLTHTMRSVNVFSSDDLDDRTDQMFLASYTQMLCRNIIIQPYYRFKYTHFTHFTEGRRNDTLHSLGLGLYWIVCPNFNIRAFAGYDIKNSDNSNVADYHQFNVGGGLNLNFKF